MARPKSMGDFTNLLDPSYEPLAGHHPEKDRPRKKASISLAAGLIMNSEIQSPKSMIASPRRDRKTEGSRDSGATEGLFYAYAQTSNYTQSLPYIIAFASASIANEWWNLVKKEYPLSERIGPQLFILKGNDMPSEIQDNFKFYHLRNKWFLMSDGTEGSTDVIPLQDWNGNPVSRAETTTTSAQAASSAEEDKKREPFDMAKLSETLDAMTAMISENGAQIRALSVAQSEGLQRMQEINETNVTQIKALADNQAKLHTLINENASHYIALSNSSFSSQEQVKSILQTNAEQIHALADGQNKMATTCSSLMATIADLGTTVARVGDEVAAPRRWVQNGAPTSPFSAVGNCISPPPRKLNRRIKSIWYEYDDSEAANASPRRSVAMLATPPTSPDSGRI